MARFRFSFWLDAHKDDELLVAETIDELKRQRSFTATIRDGIMLIAELRQGKIDLLLRLFPWVADALRPAPGTASSDNLKTEIESLRRMIQQMDSGTGKRIGAAPLNQVVAADAADDDDELELKEATYDEGVVAQNFLAGFMAMAGR